MRSVQCAYGRAHRPRAPAAIDKRCSWCGETKAIEEFTASRGYVRSECKPCTAAWARDRYRVEQRRDRLAERGVSPDDLLLVE